MKQNRDPTDRNWILRHCGPDEQAWSCEVHIHQGTGDVYPAGVRGRLLGLPREICIVSSEGLRQPQGRLIAVQKSAEGIVGVETSWV